MLSAARAQEGIQFALRGVLRFALGLLFGSFVADLAVAQAPASLQNQTSESKFSQGKSAPHKSQEPLTEEDLKAAESLIERHLPEVRKLVEVLKKGAPTEYHKAIRDLAKSSRRLQAIQKRDPAALDLEVKLLKIQIQVDMLAAKLQMADDPKIRDRLKAAVLERGQLRLARLERQQQWLVERVRQSQADLSKIEQEIQSRQAALESQAQRDYEQLVRRSEQIRQRQFPGEL